jgi:hypothetical protein
MEEEAEDLVAHGIVVDVGTDCLDSPRVVTAEDDREVVLDHVPKHPCRDRVVDRIDRRGKNAHDKPPRCGRRIGQVNAQSRSSIEGTESNGSHQ